MRFHSLFPLHSFCLLFPNVPWGVEGIYTSFEDALEVLIASVLWESQCQKRELEQSDVVVVPACNSNTWQAKAGGIPRVWG